MNTFIISFSIHLYFVFNKFPGLSILLSDQLISFNYLAVIRLNI